MKMRAERTVNGMIDVQEQVEAILNRRHFSSGAVRERTHLALLKTITDIEAIKEFDEEEDDLENTSSDIRYDDSDGITCKTIEQLEQAQQDKKDALRQQAREMFSDEEFLNEPVSGGVIAPPDINKKLKWGYTALHFAAIEGDEAECDRLLLIGADKTVTDNGGKMPWQKAALKGFDALAAKLKP